jgi:hypothetical protein
MRPFISRTSAATPRPPPPHPHISQPPPPPPLWLHRKSHVGPTHLLIHTTHPRVFFLRALPLQVPCISTSLPAPAVSSAGAPAPTTSRKPKPKPPTLAPPSRSRQRPHHRSRPHQPRLALIEEAHAPAAETSRPSSVVPSPPKPSTSITVGANRESTCPTASPSLLSLVWHPHRQSCPRHQHRPNGCPLPPRVAASSAPGNPPPLLVDRRPRPFSLGPVSTNENPSNPQPQSS